MSNTIPLPYTSRITLPSLHFPPSSKEHLIRLYRLASYHLWPTTKASARDVDSICPDRLREVHNLAPDTFDAAFCHPFLILISIVNTTFYIVRLNEWPSLLLPFPSPTPLLFDRSEQHHLQNANRQHQDQILMSPRKLTHPPLHASTSPIPSISLLLKVTDSHPRSLENSNNVQALINFPWPPRALNNKPRVYLLVITY